MCIQSCECSHAAPRKVGSLCLSTDLNIRNDEVRGLLLQLLNPKLALGDLLCDGCNGSFAETRASHWQAQRGTGKGNMKSSVVVPGTAKSESCN